MTMPKTSLVPFSEANPETRDAFLRGLRVLRGIEGNPETWVCRVCGETIPGDAVRISYDVGDTPIPYCPTGSLNTHCSGYGPDLTPGAN
jgi:hypothetical protein